MFSKICQILGKKPEIDLFASRLSNQLPSYFLFESGYEYRTICTHRSVISALHDNIEGRPVGEHPQVSSLITGVFNNRPHQPKYNFSWDVRLVLDYLKKELPNNSDLPDNLLTFTGAMLLALTSACRVF